MQTSAVKVQHWTVLALLHWTVLALLLWYLLNDKQLCLSQAGVFWHPCSMKKLQSLVVGSSTMQLLRFSLAAVQPVTLNQDFSWGWKTLMQLLLIKKYWKTRR